MQCAGTVLWQIRHLERGHMIPEKDEANRHTGRPQQAPDAGAASRAGLILLFMATLGVAAWAHHRAGFTLPNPWNDEPWFLYSAISLAEQGTFFSESLNPDRVVPMSPVYQIPLALLFKLAGFSFALARWVSWFYMILALLGFYLLAMRRSVPLLAAAVTSLFFLSATPVVAGNMARPEAMLFAVATWSVLAVDCRRPWIAVSLAGVGVLIHPAGAFLFVVVLLLAIRCVYQEPARWWPGKLDVVVVAAACAMLLAQLAFMAQHTEHWASDAAAAADHPFKTTVGERVFSSNKTPWLLALVAMAALGWLRFEHLAVPATYGAGLFFIMLVRPQMWYEIYNVMAILLATLCVAWLGAEAGHRLLRSALVSRAKLPLRRAVPLLCACVVLLPLLRFSQAHGFVTGPRNYPAKLEWGWGMQMDPHPYLTEDDVQRVVAELERQMPSDRKVRVFFMPEGDALFFHGRLPNRAIPYMGVWTSVRGDMAVFRFSRHQPEWMREKHVEKYLRLYGGEGVPPFYERDGTEKWMVFPVETAAAL